MRKFILSSPWSREKAKQSIDAAPQGYVVSIGEPKRTIDQSDKMWAMCTDISVSCPVINGQVRRHTPDDWKAIAMNALGWECQFIEGVDGRPFPKGFRSSHLTKSQMSLMIDWLQAFGDEHGVRWTWKDEEAA